MLGGILVEAMTCRAEVIPASRSGSPNRGDDINTVYCRPKQKFIGRAMWFMTISAVKDIIGLRKVTTTVLVGIH